MKIRDISITVRTLGQQSCYLTVTLAEVVVYGLGEDCDLVGSEVNLIFFCWDFCGNTMETEQ